MISELQNLQAKTGAIFETSSLEKVIPMSFGNDTEAIHASQQGVALYDRSHWGLLKISGEDRLRFLHNQSTNSIQTLKPGEGCDTVFVTSTARTLDLATVFITEDAILLLISPNRRQQLMEWLDRFIFPMDQVELQDLSSHYSIFSLLGPDSRSVLQKLGVTDLQQQPLGCHQLLEIAGSTVRISAGSGLTTLGYTFIIPTSAAVSVWQTLTQVGAIPLGEVVWQHLRIRQGRPVPDAELTEAYNPLEAGLWQTLSFDKGCYIGQETIARLNTYKGVKQQLWGIRLNAPVSPGTPIWIEDAKVGILTSYTNTDGEHFGLGYIRTKAGGVGSKVKVGEIEAEVVDVPFLKHPPL
ncbi:Putative transferase At1g60990, chloroplastic [Planktothrix tepida]|uniref:Glycine cleavage T protein (Aminomethyl transferase) n=2 Tax=Planktothrix TaxID=54304 RepID=A0A1J1LJF8_9CYAN|nr:MULTISPECIES: folate-binding protein YgfZ [Planktothrix]CAD5933122.1 Putative transferase At1g60990, chloroplastic [Planktothrix tepida]CAD5977825.1 Putative transferase At1g60990, chloroplastic [Planktothrix pseudagardhii]CUR31713.1 Glycine cleavage T protein (Aminomethyl transferase) [Planktothrix tepida PCC 9214]